MSKTSALDFLMILRLDIQLKFICRWIEGSLQFETKTGIQVSLTDICKNSQTCCLPISIILRLNPIEFP